MPPINQTIHISLESADNLEDTLYLYINTFIFKFKLNDIDREFLKRIEKLDMEYKLVDIIKLDSLTVSKLNLLGIKNITKDFIESYIKKTDEQVAE